MGGKPARVGADVVLRLPLLHPQLKKDSPAGNCRRRGGDMSEAHILVVDDEPDIRILVKEILEDEGYTVVAAEDGTAARKALRDRRPDLILLDIWMPDIDGISLLREWSEGEGIPAR